MTMWASHTDTVHRSEGYQKISLHRGVVTLADNNSNCLGADCTVGVWIMREMIDAGIPGHYVFHYGEEKGCVGSSGIVKSNPEYFRRAKAIISFDRRGSDEVITFQRGARTCSDAFAESLAAMLPRGYAKSDKGVYTDSAEYAKIIPECTNVSVGYQHEHHEDECVDLQVVVKLLTSILKFWDERNLIIERDPSVVESKYAKWENDTTWGYYGGVYTSVYRAKVIEGSHGLARAVNGEYHAWENGHLVKYASEQARLEAWLDRKAQEDQETLNDRRILLEGR